MKKHLSAILSLAMVLSLTACAATETNKNSESAAETESSVEASETEAGTETEAAEAEDKANGDAHTLELSDDAAKLDGVAIEEFDYTRTISPDSEDEIFTGTEPSTDAACYIAHDIIYYPELDTAGFTAENYDGETEWVYHYTAEGLTDYIFSCLPYWQNTEISTDMMHSAEEAYENKVLHITQAGTYVLSGSWHGQIWIDLGDKDETFTDENAKVTLVMNGVDVTCDVAPALVFYSVYECDNTWEDRKEYTNTTDLTNAGAHVILTDGTENNFTGENVYRLLKAKYKKEGSTVQKKRYKIDAAFYSYVSMLIEGEEKGTGILNVTSGFEGLDTELHLTIDSGYINIVSQDDGMNVNEDGVSVLTVNGGHLSIFAGQGNEGDVVDSNGFIKVNGGFIAGSTPSPSDDILDSDCGTETSEDATVINGTGSEGMGAFGPGPNGGFDPQNGNFNPENGERPELPEGVTPGDGQTPPNNGQTPPGGFGGGQPQTGESTETTETTTSL